MREILQQALDFIKLAEQRNYYDRSVEQQLIAALEAELVKPINEFNPDWGMIASLIERVNALEAELYEYKRKKVYKFISEIKMRDKEFRKWYDKHGGSEAYAYDVWCAAWEATKKPEICICENIQRCTIFDKCMKHEKD